MGALRADRPLGRLSRPFAAAMAAALVVAVGSAPAQATSATATRAPQPRGFTIAGDTPATVASNAARRQAHHDAAAVLSLSIGLSVHNSAALDAVIRAASTPGSPDFGKYLTPTQYMTDYAPTTTEVAAVRNWLTAEGMHVTGVSPDHLIVSAHATTATAERAFAVTMNDYRSGSRTFFSNDVAPSVPADLGVHWISGLNDSVVVESFAAPRRAAVPSGGYRPSDFQQGYNVTGVPLAPAHRAADESIGFTLWGAPLNQSDLTSFATNTLSQPITVTSNPTPGPDNINFVPCSVASCNSAGPPDGHPNAWDETALDVESAHGVAPGSHLKYWLGSMSVQGSSGLQPDFVALENAVNAAANDPTVNVVSNSWGFGADVSDPTMDASLQHAAAVGKTFFFSSDDTADISYPATSPYVVSVGGTTLNLDGSFNYSSESAWAGSGNGCSGVFGRPAWQSGVGAATCGGRAVPDVAADADPATGAYVFFNGGHAQIGGTSLATPLWAGMTAIWNEALLQAGRPSVGFVAPTLYSLANNPAVYHSDFHDVTTGSAGGHAAGPGWDEVTGWGSPNLANLVAQFLHETPTTTTLSASSNPLTIDHAVRYTATVSPVPASGTVAFRQNGATIAGCGSVAPASGLAGCTVAFGRVGTVAVQASFTGTADLAGSVSNTVFEQVNPPPGPPPGYWMVGSTGAVYAFGASRWHGNADTVGVTHLEPTPSRGGYWIVNRAGQVYAFGGAPALGNAAGLAAGEAVSSLSSTPSGHGYWLFTSRGRALRFGDARFFGDLSRLALNGPVVGSVATPSGNGYYMVASDGGVFAFGDARFFGSTGGIRLNRPVNGLVPTPTNRGYWMVASDGGIFAFGDAVFRGSMGATRLNQPVVGMVRYGNGYLMVGSDGGIFDFSDKPFLGSLAGTALFAPIVSVAS